MAERRRYATGDIEAVLDASRALRSAQTMDEMLHIVVDVATSALSSRTAAVFMLDEDSGDLVARAWKPQQPRLLGRRQVRGRGIVGHVADSGAVHRSPDALYDPIASVGPDEEAFVRLAPSSITAPLRTSRATVGVLHVGFESADELTDEREALLAAIAEELGGVIHQRLAHEQLESLIGVRTRELEQANAALLELDRLKDEFVSNVSHELRTPLTNIKLYLNLLQRGREEKRERYLSVLVQEADRLNALVDDLLDLSRLDMARTRGALEPTAVDLEEVVTGVMQGMQARADEHGLVVRVDDVRPVPSVSGDRNQLVQVVANLTANAINYTKPGGTVSITLTHDDQWVRLHVSDNGVGMDPADRSRAFDRFHRGLRAKEAGVPGTGLGLAIVREIVALHHGRVFFDEEHAPGTCVVVLLPVASDLDGAT